ncbi:MAG: ROK family protein [Microbacterium sp.]|uniref:ROK family protein n=1 Tax=Microbacterium sp. TaxID=51671 RepID=UPI0039E6A8C1
MSDAPVYLGIDMGGTNIRAAVVDADGTVLESGSAQLPVAAAERATLPVEIARSFRDRVSGVGLAVAGTVADGVLTWSANLRLSDVDLAGSLRAATGLPVAVLNDARAAGFAEALVGAGRGAPSVLSVTVGTGIGGALVVAGSLVVGMGDAGEIGHMVVDPDGPSCTCGRHGCWERFVGGRALAEHAERVHPGHPAPLERLLADAATGEAEATSVLSRATDMFALGLDNLHAIFAPAVVVLGGGIIARDGVVARRYLGAAARTRWGSRSQVRRSELGDAAGLIGAALASAASKETNQVPMAL